MKFNFKKIVSVFTSTVMITSTLALAAAANAPAPFVQGGVANSAVVVGSSASADDMSAAAVVKAYLDSQVTSTGSSSLEVQGDFVNVGKKSSDTINLGDALNAVYSSTLTGDKLTTVLADGVYTDTDGTDYDYEQKLTLGSTNLTHFANSDVNADEKPVIGFDIASNTKILTYNLSFTDTPLNSSMDDTYIDILGKNYYISDVASSGSDVEVTLLDTANSATVKEGEPQTVTVGNATYTVELVSAREGTPDKATLIVNGKKLDSTNKGNTRKIADNTYLSILDVFEGTREKDVSFVEFSIGTGKIVLKDNGANVEMNDEQVDDLVSNIQTSSGEITNIGISWINEDEKFLVPGTELVLPGLKVVKLSMPQFNAGSPETLSVKNNGENYIELKNVAVTGGEVSNFPLLYTNSSKTGFAGLGKDSTHRLLTSTGNTLALNESQNPKFAATYYSGDKWDSRLFELVSINELDSGATNETIIKDLATGNEVTIKNADNKDLGELNLAISSVNGDAGTATLTVTHSGSSSNVHLDKIVTKEGLKIQLPVNSVTTVPGILNLSNSSQVASWTQNFTEGNEDKDVDAGTSFTLTLGHTASKGPQVSGTSVSTLSVESGSDDTEGYVVGKHATKVVIYDNDQDSADITYHGDEAYADVLVSEASSTVSNGNSGILIVKDNEASAMTGKNLVVVGGSCINTVAAKLLGSNAPLCGSAWEQATGAGAGSFVINSYAYGGQIATLVAGYNKADTAAAADYLKAHASEISTADGAKVKKTSATGAALV